MTIATPPCGSIVYDTGSDPTWGLAPAESFAASKGYSEEELEGGSETLSEAEKEAVRLKQGGEPFVSEQYGSARRKLNKSQKVADTRNVGKERGGPNK